MGYQHRVVKFKSKLDEHLNRLRHFMSTREFADKVAEAEQSRLREQESLMGQLSDVLCRRIESFRSAEGSEPEPDTGPSTREVAEALGPNRVFNLSHGGATPVPPSGYVDVLTLDSIGDILSTSVHGVVAYVERGVETVSFYGKFDCTGAVLQELPPKALRAHLIAAEPCGPAGKMTPRRPPSDDDYILCHARRVRG